MHTTSGLLLDILEVGAHNKLAGPDFFNAKIRIDGQLWAGNVEVHLKSSDWYAHHHEQDENYDNVILHVVWEDDCSVFRKDNSEIPTLALKRYIPDTLLESYQKLFQVKRDAFINCGRDITLVNPIVVENWLERMFFERLERKTTTIFKLLQQRKNNWEAVLYALLLKNFGSKINGDAFYVLAMSLDFSIVRKSDRFQLEALLLGMAHLLESDFVSEPYYGRLKTEFDYLYKKFGLNNTAVPKPAFFKLRPANFPTIRLSQFAHMYGEWPNLFQKVVNSTDMSDLEAIFSAVANSYWDTHYTFGKVSAKRKKKLSKKFIALLTINTVIPLKFCYAKHRGIDANAVILKMMRSLKGEENSILTGFRQLGLSVDNAQDGQALLQLYHQYCVPKKCMQCAIGNQLIRH